MSSLSIRNLQSSILILGIDPGSRVTGYGIIESGGNRHRYVASGCVISQGKDTSQKLAEIYGGICEVIRLHKPAVAAIEQVFVNRNINSALKLGQARGVAMVAAATNAIPVHEYTPRRIKQSVVGYGGADKIQVQHMIKCLLNLSGKLAADAADALAVAICHAHNIRV